MDDGLAEGLNAPLVVFLVILGAAAITTMGYGVHRLIFGLEDSSIPRSDVQEQYMRDVRRRNMAQLEHPLSGHGRR